ncbi:MAG: hypothetical protein J2O46_04150 [Nocardioides sp.]|nr:hypothetical protein [Nocardioides sp.]
MAAAAITLMIPYAAEAAAPTASVRPLPLPVGSAPTVPYVTGEAPTFTVHDGSKTVQVQAPADVESATYLGRSGAGYVLKETPYDRGPDHVVRAEPGKPVKVLLSSIGYYDPVTVSHDGRWLLWVSDPGGSRWVHVMDSTTGNQAAEHVFGVLTGPVPLDAHGTKVVIGGWSPLRTMVWDLRTGTITTVAKRNAYAADLTTDRLATYTGDPSSKSTCTVVSTLSKPGTTLWRSCTETVSSFSPDGARVMTVGIAHASNNRVVRRRSVHGTLLTTYQNPNNVYPYAWETTTRVLLTSYSNDGQRWLVRCEVAQCERAVRTN